jgi:signal transduction histidine kinase/CheY-like chemotaxis protein
MKISQVATILLLVFMVLAWVPLHMIDTNAATSDRTLVVLDRVSMMQNALSRDALSARAGLLRNYDALGREENMLDVLVDQLRQASAGLPDQAAAVEGFAAVIDEQATLVERFKSNNALLQNSLAYFQLFSSQLGDSNDPATVNAVKALDAAMLQLALDTSPAAADAVADRLAQLAALQPPGQPDARASLLAHGNMLHALLPRTDGVLRALYGVPIKTATQTMRAVVQSHQAVSQRWAARLRMLFYGTSVVLLGFLIYLAAKLKERAQALRERAAFEHATAQISLRFLNAAPDAVDPLIRQSLAEFAVLLGAQRAYFRHHVWSAESIVWPSGWPDAAPALAALADGTDAGVIHIPSRRSLAPGPVQEGLSKAGLRGWLVMASKDDKGLRRVLGFDALASGRITDPAGLGFVRMALDVLVNAEQKQMLELDKARLAMRLQQARRMETVGALASGIAHNFNNLIGAILGHAEMAEAAVVPGSRVWDNLSEIRGAGNRARDLVAQILDYGRPRHRQRRAIDVDRLIAEAASLLHATVPPLVELVVLDLPEPAWVEGEIAQLQQVLLNLCNNAVQAMAQGGRIEIAGTFDELSAPLTLDRGELSAGRYVRVSVADTGRGMSEEVLRRIFDPFFTTREAGNGLGLATVKEIVIEHGGAIQVRSTPGVGSRFEVWLPRLAAPAAGRGETIAPVSPLARMEAVLLLDDDRDRLERDEEILAAIGYEPVGFTRLSDAVAACRNTPDRFDALVVGQIAVLAVAEVVAALHQHVPGVPILLATPSADEMDIPALTAAGVREVVSRPLDPAEIATALSRALAPRTVAAEP